MKTLPKSQLQVKRSRLPKAGKGLFTKQAIKKGEAVIEYKGEIINWKEYSIRVKENRDGYLFFVNNKHCIDAYPTPKHIARYANDASGLVRVKGLRNNCVYEVHNNKCFIVATRNIEAGEEIFVDYTKEYWDSVRYNIKHGFEPAL
ncbi:MAG: SET domain-containing protein [Sphingobacteriaceae bacterium]|nr:SET domain-containing protein [Sphingobacteriaceae bacterium]